LDGGADEVGAPIPEYVGGAGTFGALAVDDESELPLLGGTVEAPP
jgi:hypothetical protein